MGYSRVKTDEGIVLVAQHENELQKIVRLVYRMDTELEQKDKRIKELESTILDLQSELARKKMSLTVACNRVEELEGKLAKCQDIAMGLGMKYNEQQDKLKVAIDALTPYANAENKIVKIDALKTAKNALNKIGELK